MEDDMASSTTPGKSGKTPARLAALERQVQCLHRIVAEGLDEKTRLDAIVVPGEAMDGNKFRAAFLALASKVDDKLSLIHI
eukprot:2169018-Prorocentrum_lima.AAC.1